MRRRFSDAVFAPARGRPLAGCPARACTRHLDKPTVGEIRQAGEWQQWDGRRWVNIKMPNIVDDLIELQRSVHAKYRRGWTKLNPNAKDDQLYQFTRNVYRLRPGAKIIRIDD